MLTRNSTIKPSCKQWMVCLLGWLFLVNAIALAEEAHPLLTQADELLPMIGSPTLRVLDVRDSKAYQAGHIEGAIFVDLAAWKKASPDDASMIDANLWGKNVGDLGIDGSETIVVYGSPLTEAARVWWILRYVGCKDVRLLDGGVEAFQAAGGMLVVDPTNVTAKIFKPHFQSSRFVTGTELKKLAIDLSQCKIIDNRTPEEFAGKEVRGPRGGHIPDATNSDWRRYVGTDGKLLPKEQLADLLEADGIDLSQSFVTHCQSGGRSSVGAFVVELVTGKPAKNYYRSWSEWSARDEFPVVKPEAP